MNDVQISKTYGQMGFALDRGAKRRVMERQGREKAART